LSAPTHKGSGMKGIIRITNPLLGKRKRGCLYTTKTHKTQKRHKKKGDKTRAFLGVQGGYRVRTVSVFIFLRVSRLRAFGQVRSVQVWGIRRSVLQGLLGQGMEKLFAGFATTFWKGRQTFGETVIVRAYIYGNGSGVNKTCCERD
jgi:hypothetical protein